MAFSGRSLPDDLAREILLKLRSTKSVVRLSGVCKSWRDLITKDPDFREKLSSNIIKSEQKIKNDDDPLLVCFKNINYNKHYYYKRHDTRKKIRLHLPEDLCLVLVGSCNGLVCFREETDSPELHIHLYNPITREHRKLPPSSIRNPFHCGFGFDSLSDDYKVISIPNASKIEIYKLSTNRWSELNVGYGIHNPVRISPWCVYVNGFGYWILYEGSHGRILAFDFATEKFDIINLPREAQGGVKHNLSVLDDSVAVCLTKVNCFMLECAFEVWELSKNGNNEHSFAKKFCIKGAISMWLKVLHLFKGNTLCWVDDTSFFQMKVPNHNMSLVIKEKENARMLILHCGFFPALVFKPSLVSLRTGSFPLPAS